MFCYVLPIGNNSKYFQFYSQDNYYHRCKPIFTFSRWLAWRLGAEIIATTTPLTALDLIVDVSFGLTTTKTYDVANIIVSCIFAPSLMHSWCVPSIYSHSFCGQCETFFIERLMCWLDNCSLMCAPGRGLTHGWHLKLEFVKTVLSLFVLSQSGLSKYSFGFFFFNFFCI